MRCGGGGWAKIAQRKHTKGMRLMIEISEYVLMMQT